MNSEFNIKSWLWIKTILVLLLVCLVSTIVYSQEEFEKVDALRIAQLKKKLAHVNGVAKIDYLNDLTRELIMYRSFYEEALQYSNQAHSEALKLNYKKGEAFALIHMAHYDNLRNPNQPQTALDAIHKAIAIGESLKNNTILGWANSRLAETYYLTDKQKAIELGKKASYFFEKAGSAEDLAETSLWVCDELIYIGNYEEAFPYCKKAVKAAQKKRTHNLSIGPELVQGSLLHLSKLYEEAGDFPGAMNCLMDARNYGIKNKFDWYMDDAIGILYDKMGKHDSANYYLQRNLDIQNTFYPKMFMGESYLASKQIDKAAKIFKEYEDSVAFQRAYPMLRLNLGQIYENSGNYDRALFFARRGVTTVKEPHQKLEGYLLMARIYKAIGKSDSAYYFSQKYAGYKDSVFNKQLQWRINEKLYRFQQEAIDFRRASEFALLQKDNLLSTQLLEQEQLQKEQKEAALELMNKDKKLIEQQLKQESYLKNEKQSQISLLDRDNKIKQQQIKQGALVKNVLIGGLLIFLLSAVVIFRNLSLNRKNENLKRTQMENELRLQQLENEKKHSEMQQQATELEMQALRAQMNPHFIFNCLSSINKYIIRNETEAASDYLTRFSRLIRMVLINSQKSLITLEDELDMLRHYLDMERLRFNNVFDYNISFKNTIEPAAIFIPPLLLQPFCENAIWHGLMHKTGQGKLDITLYASDDILYCTITDNGVGREKAAELKSKSSEQKKSLGLKITNNRLALLNKQSKEESYYEMNDIVDAYGNTGGTQVDIKIRYKDVLQNAII